MFGWLQTKAWQVGTFAAAGAAIIASVALVGAKLEARGLRKEVATLDQRINAPKTGYVSRLEQCGKRADDAEAAVKDQNTKIDNLRRDGAARLATTQAALRVVELERDKAMGRIAILGRPLVAADKCERTEEMRQRILETLK